MADQLVKWHKDLKSKGLVIIDIDDGSIDEKDAIKKRHEKKGIQFPTLWDKDGTNCKAYGVNVYPAQYLIGVDGKVIWEGFAMESEETMKSVQETIKKELEKVKKEDLEKDK